MLLAECLCSQYAATAKATVSHGDHPLVKALLLFDPTLFLANLSQQELLFCILLMFFCFFLAQKWESLVPHRGLAPLLKK